MGAAQRARQAARNTALAEYPHRDHPLVAKRKKSEARKAAKEALVQAYLEAAEQTKKEEMDKALEESKALLGHTTEKEDVD